MKKILFCLLTVTLPYFAFSQIFLKKKPEKEKSDVSFAEPTPSIMFFGVDNGSQGFQAHKINIKKVYAYFGAVYADFPIFDISSGKLVEYKNTTGKYFFYRPNTKKPFGMVISNGKGQPIMVNNPDQYLKTIKTYLNIGSADYLVPKTLDTQDKHAAQVEMAQIIKSTFVPDQAYAEKLIKNSNTVHYMKASKTRESPKCNCPKMRLEMFKDSLLTEKSSISMDYIYNDKRQFLETINYTDGKPSGSVKYIRNPYGLIDKMITDYGTSAIVTRFIYEKDKFYTVFMDGDKPGSFETFYLNDQMQCVRRLSKRDDQSIVWDINYIYDKFGRIVRESQQDSEMIYTYNSDQDDLFSGFRSYSLSPKKLQLDNRRYEENNKLIFSGKDGDGKQTFKSITITEKDCSTKTFSYDQDNKLTAVGVISCKQ